MKKKFLAAALVLVLSTAAGLWYTRPQTIWEISGLERDKVTELMAYASEGDVVNGHPILTRYTLDSQKPSSPEFAPLLNRLEESRYRARLRNLLPIPQDRSTSITGPYINLDLISGEDWCVIDITSPKRLRLTFHGTRQFSIANSSLQDNLFQYLKEHGDTDTQESQP